MNEQELSTLLVVLALAMTLCANTGDFGAIRPVSVQKLGRKVSSIFAICFGALSKLGPPEGPSKQSSSCSTSSNCPLNRLKARQLWRQVEWFTSKV